MADHLEPCAHHDAAAAFAGGSPAWRWVYLAMVALTLGSHAAELAGVVSCNPVYGFAGLLAHGLQQFLPGGCRIDGNDGTTLQALGGAAAEQWLHGQLPWWNSYAGLGLPLAAEGQPGAFFLPFVLLQHFVSGTVVLMLAMQALAGVSGVALFRELGLSRTAGAVGGALIVLNGTFAWFAVSHTVLPFVFLPGLLFALERCRARAAAGRAGGPMWVALALGYSLVAGFPETAFMDGLLAAVWAVSALLRTPRPARSRFVMKLVAGGLAGLAVSAPAWVSFADYLNISSVGGHTQMFLNRLDLSQAVTLVLPSIFGPPYADWAVIAWGEDGGYFGPALALLAILALTTRGAYTGLRWAMAGWVVFWLSVFFGAPVTRAIWLALPPLNEVEVTRYAMPSLECAAIVLAALVVDDWRRGAQRLRGLPAGVVLAAVTALTLWLAWRGPRLPTCGLLPLLLFSLSLLEAALAAAALLWLVAAPPNRRRVLALVTVVAFDASLHFILPEFAGARPNTLGLGPVKFLRAHAGLSRVYSFADQLPTNYGSWFGVPSIQALSLPFARAWGDAANAIGGNVNMATINAFGLTPGEQLAAFRGAAARLRAAGVGFVLVSAVHDPFAAAPERGMSVVYQDSRARIYGMAGVAPYFETQGVCRVTTLSRERVHTDCEVPARLIRRELLLPGWHAQVNGAKVAVTSPPGLAPGVVDSFMQTVALPAGPADVAFRYVPPHAGLIAWLFAIGLGATVLMALRDNVRLPGRFDGAG